jgi:hypothetical protein
MKKLLTIVALGEAATGLAFLSVPSVIVQLLFAQEPTGVAITLARVTGIVLIALGVACWPGPALAGMLTHGAVVALYSCLPWFRRCSDRCFSMASGRPSRDPDCVFDL